MVSAHSFSRLDDNQTNLRQDDVISKPYRIEEMVSKIQQLLVTRDD